MKARIVRGIAAAALLAAIASPLAAQRQKEIRVDLASVASNDGTTIVNVGFPATTNTILVPQIPLGIAFGIYMNKNIAIEPTVQLISLSGNGSSSTNWGLAVAVPYYFAGDFGKSGWFVSPALSYTDIEGSADAILGYGADVGLKWTWKDMVSWRAAAFVAQTDIDGAEATFGAKFGMGFRWK